MLSLGAQITFWSVKYIITRCHASGPRKDLAGSILTPTKQPVMIPPSVAILIWEGFYQPLVSGVRPTALPNINIILDLRTSPTVT